MDWTLDGGCEGCQKRKQRLRELTMNPKVRDHIAIAAGSAAVLYALRQKKNAQITVAAALGGAIVLWMIHQWENTED